MTWHFKICFETKYAGSLLKYICILYPFVLHFHVVFWWDLRTFCHCRKLDGCGKEIPERIPLFTYWLKKFWWYGMHENMQIHKDSSLLGNSIESRRLFDDGDSPLFSMLSLIFPQLSESWFCSKNPRLTSRL